MKKKLLNLLLLVVFLGFGINKAFSLEYTDLSKDHWAYSQIEKLTNAKVLVGYPDGSFHPDENVTRAEFATMVIKSIGQDKLPIKKTLEFSDIDKNFWAWNTIQRAVSLDIIQKKSDNAFKPDADVTRAQALEFVVNALDTKHITEEQAKKALVDSYDDYELVPEALVLIAGKAEVLGIVVKVPEKEKVIEAERAATRAELAAFLYNLREQVQIRANEKIKEAMKPKKASGIVIPNVKMEGVIATIPAGTIIPVVMKSDVSSQESKLGEVFITKTPKNFVTKENYLLIKQDTPISGQLIGIKPAKFFIRNGELCMEAKSIKMQDEQVAKFCGYVESDLVITGFWKRLFRKIFKGAKLNIKNGDIIDVQVLKPIKVNTFTGMIVE